MSVKIFVEGGGDGNATITKCRKGFEAFFGKMLTDRNKPSVTPGGGGHDTFKLFEAYLPKLGDGDFAVLLLDSEFPISEDTDPWEFLEARTGGGFKKPELAKSNDVHFMVECVESWFLAETSKLAEYYGACFKAEKLPKPVNGVDIECHSKSKIKTAFKSAIKKCNQDQYEKSDAFEIIALIDPEAVCRVSYYARRLRDRLKAISPKRS